MVALVILIVLLLLDNPIVAMVGVVKIYVSTDTYMDSLKVFNLVLILNMALLITGILALGAGAVVGVIFSSKTTTENIANETVQGLISVANSAAQGCQVSADEIQSTNISGLTGTSFTIDENWSQYLILNTDCIQSVSVQNNIQQLMAQEAQQLAQSISQQFQLASAASKNVVNATADLSTQVSNSFNQQCSGYESQIQTFTLSDSTNVTGTIYLNWEQYNASTFSCVMQDEAVNNTTQQLDQDV